MSVSRRFRVAATVGAFAVLLMGTAGGYFFWQEVRRIQAEQEAVLPVLGLVPDFTLVERSGREVGLADLAGKVWIADFIFTHCAGPCPLLSMQMKGLQAPLQGLPDVRLVSFTVDPDRDTPEALSEYAERYGADPERWLFLTGEKAKLYGLIRQGFRVTVDNSPEDEASGQIMHSLRFALVDRQGQVRAYYNGTDPDLEKALLPDVAALLREE